MQQHNDDFDYRLGDSLHFSQEDLQANREGRISSAQQQIRRGKRIKDVLIMLALSVVMGAAIALHVSAMQRDGTSSGLLIAMDVVLGLCIVALLARIVYIVFELRGFGDLHQVDRVSGAIQLSQRGARTTDNYRSHYTGFLLYIRGRTFRIPYEAYFALKETDPYTVYFVPRTGELLSLEQT